MVLVMRGGRQLNLTDEGRQLADAVLGGMSGIEAVIERLTEARDDRPLTVTSTPAFASSWLMPRLADFQRQNPGLSLMLDPTPVLQEIGPGGADLALRYGAGVWSGLEAELLVNTPIAIVAAPDLVGEGGEIAPGDLTGYHWLQELGTNEASEFLELHGRTLDRSKGVTSLPGNLMLDAARDGRGVAVIARAFVEADLRAGRLRLLYEDSRKKGYYLVWNPTHLRGVARSFRSWVREQARRDGTGALA